MESLPVSTYHTMLEQSFNIACLYLGSGFEFMTARESQAQLRWEYEQLVAQGLLKPKPKQKVHG